MKSSFEKKLLLKFMCAICKTHINSKSKRDLAIKNRTSQRLEEATVSTLIAGKYIANVKQRARFIYYQEPETGKAVAFTNDKKGFANLVARTEQIHNSKAHARQFKSAWNQQGITGRHWRII